MLKSCLFILAACLAAPAFAAEAGAESAEQYDQWVVQGQSLSATQAAVLEQALLKDPLHAARRAKLLGYYFVQPGPPQGYHPDFKRHYAWWIEREPRSPVFESPHLIFWGKDREMTDLWVRVLDRLGKDELVARHAAAYFLLNDPRKCDLICDTAIQAGGKGLDFYVEASRVLNRRSPSKAEIQRVFAYVETAYKNSAKLSWKENQPNFNLLTRLAGMAGNAAKTRKYQKLWDRAEEFE